MAGVGSAQHGAGGEAGAGGVIQDANLHLDCRYLSLFQTCEGAMLIKRAHHNLSIARHRGRDDQLIKLTDIEFDLLRQLCTDEMQISANRSHREMYRLVEAGYVKASSMNSDAVLYTILPRGWQALEQEPSSASRRARSFASATEDGAQHNRKARRPRRWAA